MPEYKGKRNTITFPVEVYEEIAAMAKQETRTVSQMVVVLCQEAIAARENKQEKTS
ncbi:hypothetical protein FNW02_34980 [Komarekiella sp. 'clone 1']|uniref:CopG-like ribbon-helix-helix domain-containing protein n=1 Tax=Komarekiella delphini-convector SJRDD-AB1 TaxID=2593771 RepID=A0AA40VV22_9NOST|nr:hypothetical protein [Komarekiella delphini-convector]MBD6620819.1 hypothetical protein [Komarekiella delphini-convector SJRDD-AB1]